MKGRFSSLDIVCMVRELQNLVGMRVNQIYDIDNKTYLIKFQIPEKKAVLLIESGVRFNKTTFDWPKNDMPSGFCMKLRKHLRNKRLEYLKQVGKDRIVDFQFGSGDAAYHIFVELFDKGNIILADHNLTIVNLLRFHSEGDNRCVVRETYQLEHKKKNDNVKSISEVLLSAKEGDPFRKLLMPFIDYGPACLEHVLSSLGYEKGAKIKQQFTDSNVGLFVERFNAALDNIDKYCKGDSKGYIIKKKETRATGEEFFTNVEFHPYLFHQFLSDPFDEFEDFNSAVDEFFSQMESQKIDMKALHEEKAAMKKVEKIRLDQASRLKELDKKQQVDTLKAELITYNIDKVEEAIKIIRSALAAQMSWNEISELVEKAKDDPIGSLVAKLKFETNCITLKLENPFSEGEDDTSILVDVDLDLSAYANVKKYYSNKKMASSKQQKTLQAQGIALKSAEKKVESVLKDIQMTASITKSRLVFWFEKFFWFISSENYLIIGSRDRIQAELLIRRYMSLEDIFVHSDIPGSSCFVIKNPSGGPIPPKTLNESGSMAICFSSAWTVHIIANAWWVNANQVVKMTPASVSDPFYRITGQKNYLLPGQLTIGFGFIFYVDESSAERHLGERQVKFKEEVEESTSSPQTESEVPSAESQVISDDICNLSIEEEVNLIEDLNNESDDSSDEEDSNENKVEECIDSDSTDDEIQDQGITEGESLDLNHSDSEKVDVEEQSDMAQQISNTKDFEGDNDPEDEKHVKKGRKVKSKNCSQAQRQKDESTKKKQKENELVVLKRGQRSKLKKIKEKYKDQDDEEKQLRMAILQSAGSKKENSRKSLKQAKEQQAQEKKIKRIPKVPPPKNQQEPREEEDSDIPVNTDLSMLSRLTGLPQSEDKIVFALPVVAPYSTLVSYKYRVKMTPGTSKRGKSARNALNIFLSSKESNDQEKAVMKSVNDQILCRDLPGKVKLSVGQATVKMLKKR